MKRILAGLVLAAVALSAVSAFAQGSYVATHPAIKELPWHTTALLNGANNGFALDSAVANRLGAVGVMPKDTTAGVSTLGWARLSHPTWVVADSNQIYCTLIVSDAGGSSADADSLYIMAQASYDGSAWFNLATFLGGTAGAVTSQLDQTQATGTFFGRLSKLGASGGTPQWECTYKHRTPITTANDMTTLHRYPYLRWIIGFPDAVKYSVRARVMFNSASGDN